MNALDLSTPQCAILRKLYDLGGWVHDLDQRSADALVRRNLAARRMLGFSHVPDFGYRITFKGRIAAKRAGW